MNPWIIILIVMAGIVFGLDRLIRRKKWKDDSTAEKISLIVNMLCVGPYAFLSVLGLLWGIVPGSPETPFGEALYKVTLTLGSIYFIVAFAAIILSFVFRKKEKQKPVFGQMLLRLRTSLWCLQLILWLEISCKRP